MLLNVRIRYISLQWSSQMGMEREREQKGKGRVGGGGGQGGKRER